MIHAGSLVQFDGKYIWNHTQEVALGTIYEVEAVFGEDIIIINELGQPAAYPVKYFTVLDDYNAMQIMKGRAGRLQAKLSELSLELYMLRSLLKRNNIYLYEELEVAHNYLGKAMDEIKKVKLEL